MRLLVDTCVLLWWLDDPTILSDEARSAIRDPGNEVLVSAATVWEIVIKRAIGKLDCPSDLGGALAESGFSTLSISAEHALALANLPAIHRDPFGRMLVAQALVDGLHLVSRDPTILSYRVPQIVA